VPWANQCSMRDSRSWGGAKFMYVLIVAGVVVDSVVLAGQRSHVRIRVGSVICVGKCDVKASDAAVAPAVELPLSDGDFSCKTVSTRQYIVAAVMNPAKILGHLGLSAQKNPVLPVKDPETAIAYWSALLKAVSLNEESSLSTDGYRLGAELRGDDLETMENFVTVGRVQLADGCFDFMEITDVRSGLSC
jgi:hypothetical protein